MNSRTIKSVGWAGGYRDGGMFSLNVFNKPDSATICPPVEQESIWDWRGEERVEMNNGWPGVRMWTSIGSDTLRTSKIHVSHTLK